MSPELGEYGVDWAQDEVPPYLGFGLLFTLTDGNVGLERQVLEGGYYAAYAYANVKAYQNRPKSKPQEQTADV